MPSVNHLQNPTERMVLPGGIQPNNWAGQAEVFVLMASQNDDLVPFGCKCQSRQGVGEASIVSID
jgi:hypothetical protein